MLVPLLIKSQELIHRVPVRFGKVEEHYAVAKYLPGGFASRSYPPWRRLGAGLHANYLAGYLNRPVGTGQGEGVLYEGAFGYHEAGLYQRAARAYVYGIAEARFRRSGAPFKLELAEYLKLKSIRPRQLLQVSHLESSLAAVRKGRLGR